MCDLIRAHCDNIRLLYPQAQSTVELYSSLRRRERQASCLAERICNEPVSNTEISRRVNAIHKKLHRLLGPGPVIRVNLDPRGYALKIDDDVVIYKDWGGYGIIAPEFDK